MILGLFARMPDSNHEGHHDWVSRDYADIDCKAVSCFFNRGQKCGVPSICEIDDKGSCKGYKEKILDKKIDGD